MMPPFGCHSRDGKSVSRTPGVGERVVSADGNVSVADPAGAARGKRHDNSADPLVRATQVGYAVLQPDLPLPKGTSDHGRMVLRTKQSASRSGDDGAA